MKTDYLTTQSGGGMKTGCCTASGATSFPSQDPTFPCGETPPVGSHGHLHCREKARAPGCTGSKPVSKAYLVPPVPGICLAQ